MLKPVWNIKQPKCEIKMLSIRHVSRYRITISAKLMIKCWGKKVDKHESPRRKGEGLVTPVSTVHMHKILYTNQRRPFHIRIMIHARQGETRRREKKKGSAEAEREIFRLKEAEKQQCEKVGQQEAVSGHPSLLVHV